ncbi:MAG: DUF5677 domain-containing protein, partial [Candidatus Hodarchaeota archaeon]
KLNLEHIKTNIVDSGENPDDHPIVKAMESWINAQRFTFLTEVNLGSWSGISTRKMAEEADCLNIYNFAYQPFSAAAHNMWNHVDKYNLIFCQNPLHKYHKIPIDSDLGIDVDYLYRAAKYVEKSFKLFDLKTNVETKLPSAFEKFSEEINSIEEFLKNSENIENNKINKQQFVV